MHWGLVISLFQGLRYLKNKEVFWGFFGVFFLALDYKYRGKNPRAINWGVH